MSRIFQQSIVVTAVGKGATNEDDWVSPTTLVCLGGTAVRAGAIRLLDTEDVGCYFDAGGLLPVSFLVGFPTLRQLAPHKTMIIVHME